MKKIIFLVTLFLAIFSQIAFAQIKYIEGQDYKVLENPIPLQKVGQKEAVEFFSYACPYCARLNPILTKWIDDKKPNDVSFYHIPALGGIWTFVGKVKITADKLGLGKDFDNAYFDGIHKKRNRKLLGDKDNAFDLLQKFAKVDRPTVEKAWNSLAVKNNMKKAAKLFKVSGLNGVPTVVVNGKYAVSLSAAGPERMVDIIEFLVTTTKP